MTPEASTLTSRAEGLTVLVAHCIWVAINHHTAWVSSPPTAASWRADRVSLTGFFLKHSCVRLAQPFGPCHGVET